MRLKVRFMGRTKHAIGINSETTETVEVTQNEYRTIWMALYEKGYEMSRILEAEEIE